MATAHSSPTLDEALNALTRVPSLLVASDYDGVIAPIVPNPYEAFPTPESLAALERLATLPRTNCALISGRELNTLRQLSGASSAIDTIGSHGIEFDSGFLEPMDETKVELRHRIYEAMAHIAANYGGAHVEEKRFSCGFHVRNVAPAKQQQALSDVRHGPARWEGVHVTEGKDILEVAVLKADKGEGLHKLATDLGADAAVYLGDDVTDERAFRVFADNELAGFGVKVGPGDTLAHYRIDDTPGVTRFLEKLCAARIAAL